MDQQYTPQQEPLQTHQPNESPKKPNKKLIVSAIGVSALIIIVGLTLLTQGNSQESTPPAQNSQQTQEQAQDVSSLPLAEQLMKKYPNDVIDIQQFDCKPRNDNEWYRTGHTLAIDPKNPNNMYVSVEWLGVFKSTDGGATWKEASKGILAYARSDDKTKRCFGEYPVIRINPVDSNHLIIVTSGGGGGFLSLTEPNSQTGGIYQSLDAGETWKLVTGDNMNLYATDAVFSADGSTIYYATSSSPASWTEADQTKKYVEKGLILTSSDKAKTWAELPTGIGDHTSVTNIHVDPTNPSNINASTFSAQRLSADGSGTGVSTGKDTTGTQLGILSSTDGGKSWATLPGSATDAIKSSVNSKTIFANQFYMLASRMSGEPYSYVTTDAGKTLTKTKALDAVVYDPNDTTGKRMLGFSAISIGPASQNLTLWESTDAGKSWKRTGTLPKEISDPNDAKTRISNIVWHPTEKNTIFMSGAGGHVWKSIDSGKTWTTLLNADMLSE